MSDLISRKWLMECADEGWIKFDTEKDKNIYVHLVRDIAPPAQPEQCGDKSYTLWKESYEELKRRMDELTSCSDIISRQAALDALARMMPRSYTPDGSHPGDEEIFRAQEVFADCIEALEILPSAQPATNCSEIPNSSDDTISRQAALDAFGLSEKTRKYGGDHSGYDTRMLYEIQDTLESLPAVQPETQWIPVSERMPERADSVIICCKAGDCTLVSTGRYLYKFKMWYVDVVGDLRDGVTAWMPLPEPYRGGETE